MYQLQTRLIDHTVQRHETHQSYAIARALYQEEFGAGWPDRHLEGMQEDRQLLPHDLRPELATNYPYNSLLESDAKPWGRYSQLIKPLQGPLLHRLKSLRDGLLTVNELGDLIQYLLQAIVRLILELLVVLVHLVLYLLQLLLNAGGRHVGKKGDFVCDTSKALCESREVWLRHIQVERGRERARRRTSGQVDDSRPTAIYRSRPCFFVLLTQEYCLVYDAVVRMVSQASISPIPSRIPTWFSQRDAYSLHLHLPQIIFVSYGKSSHSYLQGKN